MNNNEEEQIPIRRKLGVELVKTFYSLYDNSQLFFSQYQLTSQQYNLLKILYDSDTPLSTSKILDQMVEKNAGVSRLTDRLVAKGLVAKKTNNIDKRLIDAYLTDKGKTLCETVHQNLKIVDELYAVLTDDEVESMLVMLAKLR